MESKITYLKSIWGLSDNVASGILTSYDYPCSPGPFESELELAEILEWIFLRIARKPKGTNWWKHPQVTLLKLTVLQFALSQRIHKEAGDQCYVSIGPPYTHLEKSRRVYIILSLKMQMSTNKCPKQRTSQNLVRIYLVVISCY